MTNERRDGMLNQVILVGRLTTDPQAETTENGKKFSHITLAVPRSFKNSEGIYETDFIRCTLFSAIAANTSDYCKKGDIVGIKGRLQVSSYSDENGNTKYSTDVIAEKVTFLTSKASELKEEEE